MRKIIIGADPFPPYQYFDSDGTLKGSDYEKINKIVGLMGYTAEFILDDWHKIEEMLDDGAIDFAFQVQKTPAREEKWFFSEQLREAATSVVSLKETEQKETIADILSCGQKIGVIAGYKYGEVIDSLADGHKEICGSLEEILAKINDKEIMFGVADRGVFMYLQDRYEDYSAICIQEKLNFIRPLYVVFNDKLLCDEFNKHL